MIDSFCGEASRALFTPAVRRDCARGELVSSHFGAFFDEGAEPADQAQVGGGVSGALHVGRFVAPLLP
jgi:hypothetical protein